jgi:LAGLIDADG endonuclease
VKNEPQSEISFRVNSLQDLTNIIIPHFLKFPLFTQKAADFYLFKQVTELMTNKSHLTTEGLQEIINIKASMNLGLSDELKSNFINTVPVQRPTINTTNLPDPN